MIAKYIFGPMLFIYAITLVVCDNPIYSSYLRIVNASMIGIYVLLKPMTDSEGYQTGTFVRRYGFFSIFAMLSSFWAVDQGLAIEKSLTMVLVATNIFVVYNLLRNKNMLEFFLAGVIIAITINALVSVGVVDIGWESSEGGWRFQGTTVKSNVLANICVFGVIASLYFSIKENIIAKLYGLAGLSITLYVVVLTASKKGIFSIVLILLIFFILKENKLRFLVKTILLGGMAIFVANYFDLFSTLASSNEQDLFYLFDKLENRLQVFLDTITTDDEADESTGARIRLVSHAIDMWLSNPVFGAGTAGFEFKYGGYAHNNYVDLLANFGVIGFTMFYSLYWGIFKVLLKVKEKKEDVVLFAGFAFILMVMEVAIVSYANKSIMIFLMISYLVIERQYRAEQL